MIRMAGAGDFAQSRTPFPPLPTILVMIPLLTFTMAKPVTFTMAKPLTPALQELSSDDVEGQARAAIMKMPIAKRAAVSSQLAPGVWARLSWEQRHKLFTDPAELDKHTQRGEPGEPGPRPAARCSS